ncbi:MAG: hypothetical protein FWE10_05430, partial [Rikenellaceae bacterium]|nr:hypothetical protein [Rikenellaceae bacterium]MCL2693315.1 hypothetical protein [Rikenellaceae bacterium]
YAAQAMAIYPNVYNRYLLYRYYLGKGNTEAAEHYLTLATTNLSGMEEYAFRDLLKELRGGEDDEEGAGKE